MSSAKKAKLVNRIVTITVALIWAVIFYHGLG